MAGECPAQANDGLEALTRVRALLRAHVVARAAWLPAVEDGPMGRALADFLLENPSENPSPDGPAHDPIWTQDEASTLQIAGERVAQLRVQFALDATEMDILWLVLAPELDPAFLGVYRLFWGDRTQRWCDADFLFTTLQPAGITRPRNALDADHALVRLRLLEPVAPHGPSATHYRPAARLLSFVGGDDTPPAELLAWAEVFPPLAPAAWRGYALSASFTTALEQARDRHRLLVLEGPARAGARLIVRQLFAPRRLPILQLDLAGVTRDPDDPALFADDARLLRSILREARLLQATIVLTGVESLDKLTARHARRLTSLLRAEVGPVVFICAGALPLAFVRGVVSPLGPHHVRLTAPDGPERATMWAHLLRLPATDPAVRDLAPYPLGPEDMELARSMHRSTGEPLGAVCLRLTTTHLSGLAERVQVDLTWSDVILAPAIREQIEEIQTLGLHQDRLMRSWGLGRLTSGRGIKLLFSGPSGTGKTLICGLLAKDLGRELYRIDLSSVVSKYIGETEKQLARLFDEAADAGVALLFDEADSLFASRSTQVRSSNDRYANQGVDFLLQRLDTFDGLVILTTNLADAIDTAFTRRLNYEIRFEIPGEAERIGLWRVHLPPELPLQAGADIDTLARTYELTGGQIRKAVLRAAVLAVRRGAGAVASEDLEEAVRAEYVRRGKLPPPRIWPALKPASAAVAANRDED